MSGTTDLKLEAGKSYRTRDGKRVLKIIEKTGDDVYPFCAQDGYWYTGNGFFCTDNSKRPMDLVEEVTDEPLPDAINPPHYKQFPIEVIEVTQHLNFCLGNVIKYVLRCDYKGQALEDLQKAKWYLEREIMRRSKK